MCISAVVSGCGSSPYQQGAPIAGDGSPAAEVPLDGTVYNLETGRVLVWCPKNNPLRFVLGSLKVRLLPSRLPSRDATQRP